MNRSDTPRRLPADGSPRYHAEHDGRPVAATEAELVGHLRRSIAAMQHFARLPAVFGFGVRIVVCDCGHVDAVLTAPDGRRIEACPCGHDPDETCAHDGRDCGHDDPGDEHEPAPPGAVRH